MANYAKRLSAAAQWLAFASAVSIIFSIAISQIFLALAFVALLASGEKLRLPPIRIALGLFLLGTLISWAFSGELAAGLPQIRKFYVFLELLVVYSSVRSLKLVRSIFLTWAAFGSVTAVVGFVQFGRKMAEARNLGVGFYDYYVTQRITGFTSHWNTYSAEEMFALIMIGSFLLFAPRTRWYWVWCVCGVLTALAVVLAQTRGVWIAVAAAALYLLWAWRKWAVLLPPVVILIGVAVAPAPIQQRVQSIFKPNKIDSNAFRIVTWRTGWEMIKRHPLLGLGPEGVGIHFQEYVPPDIPRPLPAGWYGHLHNIYVHYAAERGIPTMLILIWLLVQIVVDFMRGLSKLPPGRGDPKFLLHAGIAVVLATMVEGVVELNLGDSEVLTMFLIVVACAYLSIDKQVSGVQEEPTSAAGNPAASVSQE